MLWPSFLSFTLNSGNRSLIQDHMTLYTTDDVESAGAKTSQENETQPWCFSPLPPMSTSPSVSSSLSFDHFFLCCLSHAYSALIPIICITGFYLLVFCASVLKMYLEMHVHSACFQFCFFLVWLRMKCIRNEEREGLHSRKGCVGL